MPELSDEILLKPKFQPNQLSRTHSLPVDAVRSNIIIDPVQLPSLEPETRASVFSCLADHVLEQGEEETQCRYHTRCS